MPSIKSISLSLALAGALLVLGGCASGPEVRANSDSSVNFSQYKTFGYVNPLGTDKSGYQSIVSQQLKAATTRELQARGLRYDESSPQLLVNFNGRLSDKVHVSSTPTPVYGAGYYGYRRGLYGAWPAYVDNTTVYQYKEGTLNIDVVDAARKQLVWEGVVTEEVEQKDMQQIQATLDRLVVAAMAKFPVAAPAAPASAAAK
ncbi:DUF4136 domain-containing protein [Roseateles violae]|uniref:DUF4136 domain-containing protein n=1 Tax=Roseateles violae TaxID=3058042 RepID=A0ABT8DMT7_9BURK|nr:DUF4136 domain-containing protein [Pelomonas sp. PFR6]MDN3919253.1 DUF4136 domain-containing protein [Pelomonas sp. PFR6]